MNDKENMSLKTSNDKAERFSNIVTLLSKKVGKPIVEYNPVIKGEPPSSEKINNFLSMFKDDINIISKQMDYSSAQLVNIHNLFSQEIQKEKLFTERIYSKCKVLQMYSKAQADDIYYLGDSFDNLDYVDFEKIRFSNGPTIFGGSATLPILKNTYIKPSSVSLSSTNGYIGNNHEAIKRTELDGTITYVYDFIDSKNSNNINNVIDNSPITYFQYELINVTENIAQIPVEEFAYWVDRPNAEGKTEKNLVYWHQNDLSNGIDLSITLTFNNPQMCNSIKVVPFFGNSKSITVKEINIYDNSLNKENVINSPIKIGALNSTFDATLVKNMFSNEAIIKFSERYVSKVVIVFEQKEKYATKILHNYFAPDYADRPTDGSPFYGQSRFNPYTLSKEIYDNVTFDKYSIIPKITNPNYFKLRDNYITNVPVALLKKSQTVNTKAISLTAVDQATPPSSNVKYYLKKIYYTDSSETNISQIDYVKITDPTKEFGMEEVAPMYFVNDSAANTIIQKIQSFILTNTVSVGGKSYKMTVPTIENVSYTTIEKPKYYNIPIKAERQLLNAERLCIGIRDVSLYHEQYKTECEIISKNYTFPYNIETLMLSIDSNMRTNTSNGHIVQSYISVDDGENWIQLSPIENQFSGIPEVVAFNVNPADAQKIAGISYFNYPQIPSLVNNVMVKIQILRDKAVNITPQIYSYQLIAKVKKS